MTVSALTPRGVSLSPALNPQPGDSVHMGVAWEVTRRWVDEKGVERVAWKLPGQPGEGEKTCTLAHWLRRTRALAEAERRAAAPEREAKGPAEPEAPTVPMFNDGMEEW